MTDLTLLRPILRDVDLECGARPALEDYPIL